MSDQQLLELAAKAAGITNYGYCPNGIGTGKNGPILTGIWNPLTDDGDALRLAVKLRLCVDCSWMSIASKGDCMVFTPSDGEYMEAFYDDPYVATRRAIVRAAAAIGEKL